MATMPGSAPSSPAAVACSMTGLTIFIYTTDPNTRSADALRLLGILAATTAAVGDDRRLAPIPRADGPKSPTYAGSWI